METEEAGGEEAKNKLLISECDYLNKALTVKEKYILELETRIRRIDKENGSLRYERRALEKKLKFQAEESEFWRRQDAENGRKIKKLEVDCRSLRALARRNGVEVERKKSFPENKKQIKIGGSFAKGEEPNLAPLIDLVLTLENENQILRNCLSEKIDSHFSDAAPPSDNDQKSSSFSQNDDENDPPTGDRTRPAAVSDITTLMDDFIEMEKLAVVDDNDATNAQLSKIMELTARLNPETDESAQVFRDFSATCSDALSRTIGLDKFIEGLVSVLEWIIGNSTPHHNDSSSSSSSIREEFEKHLGGCGPGTAMKLESVQRLMAEVERKHDGLVMEMEGLRKQLDLVKEQDLAAAVVELNGEMESLMESKVKGEEEIESLKRLNGELELENEEKRSRCAELEGTCHELRLRLEERQASEEKNGEEEELLKTGLEITKASAKLAECEKTILKLERHLKSLGSEKELSLVNKVLSLSERDLMSRKEHSSLRDHLVAESNSKGSDRDANAGGALVIFKGKKKKGGGGGGRIGFIKKLLLTRRGGDC